MLRVSRRLMHLKFSKELSVAGRQFDTDSMTNVPDSIISKVSTDLLQQPGHPLNRIKTKIYDYFEKNHSFHCQDIMDPIVTVRQNFDDLGFPPDHVGRTLHDSYYINNKTMLRTHMTANERQLLLQGHRSFLMAGNVFRRDEIDSTHYPVFHQLEGVHVLDGPQESSNSLQLSPEDILNDKQLEYGDMETLSGCGHLQYILNGLLKHLFGSSIQYRWKPCYFPFTKPSLEVEIFHQGKWIEVLGSGLLQSSFLEGSGLGKGTIAWAFGLGLERLAMILYDIPDIRLFWSEDPRFKAQFDPHKIHDDSIKFKPFSKYPHIARDVSFWVMQPDMFSPNNVYDLVRNIAGDLVETASLVDEFKKDGMVSQCYRIIFRAMDKSLTDDEVNEIQLSIRNALEKELNLKLR